MPMENEKLCHCYHPQWRNGECFSKYLVRKEIVNAPEEEKEKVREAVKNILKDCRYNLDW